MEGQVRRDRQEERGARVRGLGHTDAAEVRDVYIYSTEPLMSA